jgi:hypothetical protein
MAKGQQDSIAILFGIKGYEVEKVSEGEEDFMVEVESLLKRGPCPYCGCTYVYSNGKSNIRKVLRSRSRGKKVYLELRRKRWRCQGCGPCFNDGAEQLRSYFRITRQAEAEALWQLKDRSGDTRSYSTPEILPTLEESLPTNEVVGKSRQALKQRINRSRKRSALYMPIA